MRSRLLLRDDHAWEDIESMMTAVLGGTWVGSMQYCSDFAEAHAAPEVPIHVAIRSQSEKILSENTKKRLKQDQTPADESA